MIEPMTECPACGGSGGGPFGPRGSAWDVEGFECPRCQGVGVVAARGEAVASEPRPLAKSIPRRPDLVAEKRGPVSTRPGAESGSAAASGAKR